MQYEWDEEKRHSNLAKHGEDFVDVALYLDWSMAHIVPDFRFVYEEPRFIAYVPRFDRRVMVLAFTIRQGAIRIITYRKANARERSQYAKIY